MWPTAFQLTAARRRLALVRNLCGALPAFQLTAARRRLAPYRNRPSSPHGFQLTAARRRLAASFAAPSCLVHFNSQPREGGWHHRCGSSSPRPISTHSRAKAAGRRRGAEQIFGGNFNSQPREGGWLASITKTWWFSLFQLTAARRRLDAGNDDIRFSRGISTHSRAKAAGHITVRVGCAVGISTHSRAKAAG